MSDQPSDPSLRSDGGVPPRDAITELAELLQDANVKVNIGLRAQGHMPTVTRMLVAGDTWKDIGKAIGWAPDAVRDWYPREAARMLSDPAGSSSLLGRGTPEEQKNLTAVNCRCSAPSEEGTVQISASCPLHGDGTAFAEERRKYWTDPVRSSSSALLGPSQADGAGHVAIEDEVQPEGSFGYCAVCYHPLDRCSHCDPGLLGPELRARMQACLDAGLNPDDWPEPAWELLHEILLSLRQPQIEEEKKA